MCQFLESICFDGDTYPLLDYHQERVDRVFNEIFQSGPALQLRKVIPSNLRQHVIYKVRVLYKQHHYKTEAIPYARKAIQSLQVVQSDDISYGHKYADRSRIEHLYARRNDADDILIVKNGLLSDSSYANLGFLKNNIWYTPAMPLLRGVRREYLLRQGKITTDDIYLKDLHQFEQVALFNAMIDLGDLALPIDRIRL